MIPGEYILKNEKIICNAEAEAIRLTVTNTGDRPVQVGSHYHFYEANNAFDFDRDQAYGKRPDIPAGAAVRFEPGDIKEVVLVNYDGKQEVYGAQNEVNGQLKKET